MFYKFFKNLKERDNEKDVTSMKYGKDGKRGKGNEEIIIIHKHYQTILYHQV
jgi:hypothetical protein